MTLCDDCEQMMQPYLDRTLTDGERVRAEAHLSECAWCSKRYRFEVDLRMYVRKAAAEPMAPELKAKLAQLRTPLY